MFKFLKKSFSDFSEKADSKKEASGIKQEKFDKLFSDFEITLLENNVAFEVVEYIKKEVKRELDENPKKKVKEIFSEIMNKVFEDVESLNLDKLLEKKPTVILFVGTNGTGKTTSIAKFANYLKNKGMSSVFAAADTFRAAAIEQLQKHGEKLDIRVIKHKYGSDAAAVAFDAIDHAKAKGVDVVLIDTAGRQQANADLMGELSKIKRVTKPDLTILTVDMLTGNDAISQAKKFNEEIGIDAIIMTKADADEKGGALLSSLFITKKPVLFLGTGQEYNDFEKFDKEKILEKLI